MELMNGAIEDQFDPRDYIFEAGLGAGSVMTDKEWERGYNIEDELGYKLNPKNQQSSYSCVGQGFSMYKAVLDAIEEQHYTEQSAKAIYSQISLGHNRGAYLRDGAKHLIDFGSMLEALVKSYKYDGSTDESFMRDNSWLTTEMAKIAENLKGKEYKMITGVGIDYFARAIKEGHGMVAGVTGINNGTWKSTYPKPPKITDAQGEMWGHAIYFGKFRIKDGKKEVGCLNSWGNIGDKGWQWLGEEWFADQGRWTFNPWVVIDKPNNNTTMSTAKILKDKNSASVGIWMPAISEDVFKSYCANVGKEVPMKGDKVDWDKAIEGTFEFK